MSPQEFIKRCAKLVIGDHNNLMSRAFSLCQEPRTHNINGYELCIKAEGRSLVVSLQHEFGKIIGYYDRWFCYSWGDETVFDNTVLIWLTLMTTYNTPIK